MTVSRSIAIAFITAALVGSARSVGAQSPAKQTGAPTTAASVRTAIDAANARFSDLFNKGDAAGAAKVYAADAILMPPNAAPVKGLAAISEYWTGGWKAGIRNLKLATTEFAVHGNYAHELGTYELEVHKPDGTTVGQDHGKYMVLWKHGSDGKWQWYRDIYNSSVAPSTQK
jgi:ketosteroid isomerase-like protein